MIGVVTAGEVLGSATVAALGLEDDGDKSDTLVDDDMVRLDFGTAKKGAFVVVPFFWGGGGIFGGVGKEMEDEVIDDEGGSCPTDLLPLTILPSDKRYSSTPALVIDSKAIFCALLSSKFKVRVLWTRCQEYEEISIDGNVVAGNFATSHL